MIDITKLHDQAMLFAQEALIAKFKKEEQLFLELSEKAFKLEKQAAMALEANFEAEPSRAILFRSAACLAIDIKQFEEAKHLIIKGLGGNNVPIEIQNELEELLEDVNKIVKPTNIFYLKHQDKIEEANFQAGFSIFAVYLQKLQDLDADYSSPKKEDLHFLGKFRSYFYPNFNDLVLVGNHIEIKFIKQKEANESTESDGGLPLS